MECSTVAPRSAKQARPQATPVKLQCVLGIFVARCVGVSKAPTVP